MDPEVVKVLLRDFIYDRVSGVLYRKGRPITCKDKGYLRCEICGKMLNVHRIAYFMVYGFVPKYIDHINGIRDDNRIENLRPATRSQNQHNQPANKKRAKIHSIYKGVVWQH